MMPLKKRRRVQVILLAAAALAVSAGMIGYGMRDGIAFFRAPSEVAASPPAASETFRIGGLVEAGSLVRGQGEEVAFRVTDGVATIPVTFLGVLPDLFAEGQCTIAMGHLAGGTFEATQVLAKHDETYAPREVVAAMRAQGITANPCGATPVAPGDG